MLDTSTLRQFEQALVATAGGYLRNPVRIANKTCAVCATPVDGYTRCFPCQSHLAANGQQLADAVAPLTYAAGGQQAAYMMRLYKAPQPVGDHLSVVSMLMWVAISLHTKCIGALSGLPVTHWSAVPSLPPKPGEHPLHRIVAVNPPAASEAPLLAVAGVNDPRDAGYGHFVSPTALPPRSHVLVLDDTWTKGGHAQSAALTFRQAGAVKVSILVAARWINLGYGGNEEFIRQLKIDYSPRICPWTGSVCPP